MAGVILRRVTRRKPTYTPVDAPVSDKKTVRILGMAPNLGEMPPTPPGYEVWPSNSPKGYNMRLPRIITAGEWTAWVNLHSRAHWQIAYPKAIEWYLQQDGTKPIYTQKFWPDLPGCTPLPFKKIQEYFATAKGPNRYFTCSVAWLVAFAIYKGFERIELWGFMLRDTKPNERWKIERPNFFYWVDEARRRGVEVWYQPEIEALPHIAGDPDTYDGLLYGYGTKPEPDWDPVTESFATGAATLL